LHTVCSFFVIINISFFVFHLIINYLISASKEYRLWKQCLISNKSYLVVYFSFVYTMYYYFYKYKKVLTSGFMFSKYNRFALSCGGIFINVVIFILLLSLLTKLSFFNLLELLLFPPSLCCLDLLVLL